MLNELKKITSRFYVKILFVLVIIVSIITGFAAVRSFSELESLSSTNYLKGKSAINMIKQNYDNSRGVLTTDKLNEVLKYYKSIPNSDEAYIKASAKYPGIFPLIANLYPTDEADPSKQFKNMNNMNNFYERDKEIINQKLSESENMYEPWEKEIILDKANNITKPFNIEFSGQWNKLYSSLTICFIVIAISAVVLGSNIFSYEKDKNMDLLLVSLGDKSLKRIARNKVKSLIVLLTIEVLISVLVTSLVVFSNTGIDSWNNQIQIENLTSIYKLSFGQAYLLSIFAGWIGVIAIGLFVSLLNAFIEKSYITLIIGVIIEFMPIIIAKAKILPIIITKFLKAQPINSFFIRDNLMSLQVFKILGINTLTITATIITSLVILFICMLVSPNIFARRLKCD